MRRVVPVLAVLLLGCPTTSPNDDDTPTPPVGEGLLRAGCPPIGGATARLLTEAAERPFGADALAAPGDVVLLNERAAYVISAPVAELGEARTWYLYGGVPVDAVPLDGCAQVGPDQFDALGFVIGTLNLGDFPASTLRLFRGQSIEIVADGSDGGPAIVDVHGVDDTFWLIELELIKRTYLAGGSKPMSPPYGMDVTVRYTLHPDDPVLGMDVRLLGQEGGGGDLLAGTLLFPGDHTSSVSWSDGGLSVGGVNLDLQTPFFASGSPDGAWAIGLPEGRAAVTTISGVTAFLDLALAFDPLDVGPGRLAIAPFALSVGAGQTNTATAPLVSHLPAVFPGGASDLLAISGFVVDPAGAPVPYATVVVQAADETGEFADLDRLAADAAGAFVGSLARVSTGGFRLRSVAPGRDPSAWVEVDQGPGGGLTLTGSAAGSLVLVAVDGGGAPIPARALLQRSDGFTMRLDVGPDDGPLPVPPGTYTATITRGYEYGIVTTEVTIPPDGDAILDVILLRLLDTSGWISIDSHVHAEPSPDSEVLPMDRMRSAAAAGLDVVISTDHEAIIDLRSAIGEAGLDPYLGYALGSEVTATVPEHTNAWPFPPRPSSARGEHVRWYGHSLGAIYAAERERGARVVQLNHPRVNGECGILCLLDFDRLIGASRLLDPTLLGLPADEPLWSWDFDSVELMNSSRSPFPIVDRERESGMLLDWLAFWNLGHRVLGVAVTDVHGPFTPGEPRTYLAVSPDDPSSVSEDGLVEAALGARGVISAGAFATVTVGGAGPGDLGTAIGGQAELTIRVQALPGIDVQTVYVLVNCDEALTIPATDPGAVVKLETTVSLPLTQDAQVVVLGLGQDPMPLGLDGYDAATVPRFVVNPIRVDVDGDGVWTPPGGKTCALPAALWAP